MALTFPITRDGLVVDVLVNLEAGALIPLWQAGTHPPPVQCRGLIDTGTDITAVSLTVLQRLGVPRVIQTTTHGIGGSVSADLYEVSLHIFDPQQTTLPWLPHPSLLVMALPPGFPFDALIGLDIIRTCKMIVDGPAGQFTME
jgi:hypothetical protein